MEAAGGRHRVRLHVVAAVLVDDLEHPSVLLAARRSRGSLAGGWELPGGKIEPGETPQRALRRELGEELGIEVDLGPLVAGPLSGAWPLGEGGRLEVHLARSTQQPRALDDHDVLRWLSFDQVDDVDWLEADAGPVRALVERLGTTRLVVLPDRQDAEDGAVGLRSRGALVGVHRELLAGDDDLEDAQWVVAVEPGPGSLAVDDSVLDAFAQAHDGWLERHGEDPYAH